MSTAEIIDMLMPLLPLPIAMLTFFKWVRNRLNLWLAISIITTVLDFVLAGYYTLTDDPVFAILWGVIGCMYIQNCRNILELKKMERKIKEDIARINAKCGTLYDSILETIKDEQRRTD